MGLLGPNIEKLTARRDVAGLMGLLGHARSEIRADAAEALGRIGDPAAAQALGRVLVEDADRVAAFTAALALLNLGGEGSALLVAVLRGETGASSAVRAAVGALFSTGSQPLGAVLTSALEHCAAHGPEDSRTTARRKLAALGSSSLHPELRPPAPDPAAVAAAAVAGGRFTEAAGLGSVAVDPLHRAAQASLTDPESVVFEEVIRAIASIDDPSVIPALGDLVGRAVSSGMDARASGAVSALAGAGLDRRAIEALVAALSSGLPATTQAAAAVATSGSDILDDVCTAVAAGLSDQNPTTIADAARGAAALGSPPALFESLTSALDSIGRRLISARSTWKAWEDWDPMQAYMDDDSPGHSTYRMEQTEREAARRSLDALTAAEAALAAALERRSTPPAPPSRER